MKYLLILFFAISLSISCKKEHPVTPWVKVLDITNKGYYFRDIEFLDDNAGYAIASNLQSTAATSQLWFTIDGGATWSFNEFFIKDNFITKISVINNEIVGCGNQVFCSLSNGMQWTNIYPAKAFARVSDIHFKDKNIGFFTDSRVMQTLDGGATWNVMYSIPFMSVINKLIFTSNKTVYATGGSTFDTTNFGFILKSTDDGQTWQLLNTKLVNITDSYFLNDKVGFIFTFNHELFKTTDGGLTFQLLNNQIADLDLKSVFISENEGFYGGNGGFHTVDGGRSWNKEYSISGDDLITDITIQGKKLISMTKNGLILIKQL